MHKMHKPQNENFSELFKNFLKATTHLRWGNTKLRVYDAACARPVWTAHVYLAPNTNRNKPRLLSCFDVPTKVGSVVQCMRQLPPVSVLSTRPEQRQPCMVFVLSSLKYTVAVFDYPKNLTLFDTECKKVLGSSLLVVCFDYGVWCAMFDLPWG